LLTGQSVEANCAVMNELLIGYARVSTNEQDLTAQLTAKEVKLSIGGSVHDPNDPVGRLIVHRLRRSSRRRGHTRQFQVRWVRSAERG